MAETYEELREAIMNNTATPEQITRFRLLGLTMYADEWASVAESQNKIKKAEADAFKANPGKTIRDKAKNSKRNLARQILTTVVVGAAIAVGAVGIAIGGAPILLALGGIAMGGGALTGVLAAARGQMWPFGSTWNRENMQDKYARVEDKYNTRMAKAEKALEIAKQRGDMVAEAHAKDQLEAIIKWHNGKLLKLAKVAENHQQNTLEKLGSKDAAQGGLSGINQIKQKIATGFYELGVDRMRDKYIMDSMAENAILNAARTGLENGQILLGSFGKEIDPATDDYLKVNTEMRNEVGARVVEQEEKAPKQVPTADYNVLNRKEHKANLGINKEEAPVKETPAPEPEKVETPTPKNDRSRKTADEIVEEKGGAHPNFKPLIESDVEKLKKEKDAKNTETSTPEPKKTDEETKKPWTSDEFMKNLYGEGKDSGKSMGE